MAKTAPARRRHSVGGGGGQSSSLNYQEIMVSHLCFVVSCRECNTVGPTRVLKQNALLYMQWYRCSIDDIVSDKLPVKDILCQVESIAYTTISRRSVAMPTNVFLSDMGS